MYAHHLHLLPARITGPAPKLKWKFANAISSDMKTQDMTNVVLTQPESTHLPPQWLAASVMLRNHNLCTHPGLKLEHKTALNSRDRSRVSKIRMDKLKEILKYIGITGQLKCFSDRDHPNLSSAAYNCTHPVLSLEHKTARNFRAKSRAFKIHMHKTRDTFQHPHGYRHYRSAKSLL